MSENLKEVIKIEEDKPIDKIHEPHRQTLLNINTALQSLTKGSKVLYDATSKLDMDANATKRDIALCVETIQKMLDNVTAINYKLMNLYAMHYEKKN